MPHKSLPELLNVQASISPLHLQGNVCTVRYQLYTGEDLLLKGSIQTNYKMHFMTYLKCYEA